MKKFYTKFRIALLTFAFGLATFWFVDGINIGKSEVYVELPKAKHSILMVNVATEEKDFSLYTSGCGAEFEDGGKGSSAIYITNTFREVQVDYVNYKNSQKAKKEFNSRTKKVNKFISKTKEKIIVDYSIENKNRIEISKFIDKSSLLIITAPDLKLALTFEKWLEARNSE